MLGGKNAFLTLWWTPAKGFVSYANATIDPGMQREIDEVNKKVKASRESVQRLALPKQCAARTRAVAIGHTHVVGELHDIDGGSERWRIACSWGVRSACFCGPENDNKRLCGYR